MMVSVYLLSFKERSELIPFERKIYVFCKESFLRFKSFISPFKELLRECMKCRIVSIINDGEKDTVSIRRNNWNRCCGLATTRETPSCFFLYFRQICSYSMEGFVCLYFSIMSSFKSKTIIRY